jgi:alkylation response protein AidB-like acyl-CoA dehydrogenase
VIVDRQLPTPEARDLLDLTRTIAAKELAPIASEYEAGLLGLPYPEEFGGGGQPYEVYLQVLEELGTAWAAVAVAVSVHGLSCLPLAKFGTREQQEKWLPDMLGGDMIGAYSLSETQAGSDAAALACKAVPSDGGYTVNGSKAWITNGGRADFYTLFCADERGPHPRGVLLPRSG